MTTPGQWIGVRVHVPPGGSRDGAAAALFDLGSQGVQEEEDALVTYFPPGTDPVAIASAVTEVGGDAQVETFVVPDGAWTAGWATRVGAHELGELTIAPPWLAGGRDPERTIVIDPAMAFGTGEHATTRGVVRLMQGVVRPGDRVADLGAGSAVLAIAAAKLGARSVAAVELDADAISNAEENVERNGVADRVRVVQGEAGVLLPLVAPVDVVFANIISSVVTDLMPTIASALAADGRLIVSGILQDERDHMLDVFQAHGFALVREDREDTWWSGLLVRR